MNFLRLPDIFLSVLFEDEDIIAIDKPYGFNAHTNDSKIEHSDFIQDGLIEIYEKQLGRRLHIIHRLDQTTTGVMIFGKSVDSAKKYADYFFNRQVKKTYWFITENKSHEKLFKIKDPIIHKAKELEAETDFVFIKNNERFELWEAHPYTGRNHQIRIHAKAAGISILGDPKYDGHHYAFLCLHNCRIEFPNGIVISSKPPVYFDDLNLLSDMSLAKLFFEADRRHRLFSKINDDQCLRLYHKEFDFTLDQFGKKIVLNWNKDKWTDADARRFNFFCEHFKKELISKNIKSQSFLENWTAYEGTVQFELRNENNPFVGLPTCERLHRSWILNNSHGKSVLNLFSQSGTNSIMACLGQASQIVSVDRSKKNLEWSKMNFKLNQLKTENCHFFCRDSLTFLEQCKSKGVTYDLIICHAPAFFRREKGFFKIESDLENLIENCFKCLADRGELLLLTQSKSLFIDDIRKSILKVQSTLDIKGLEINCILPALDFELPHEKVDLKSFLIRKNYTLANFVST